MGVPLQKIIRKNSVKNSVVVRIMNQLSAGVVTTTDETTSGLVLRYRRDGGIAVSIAPAALSFLTSDWAAGGIEHIGDGYYRVDVPDAAFAAGAGSVVISGTLTACVMQGAMVLLTDNEIIAPATSPVY